MIPNKKHLDNETHLFGAKVSGNSRVAKKLPQYFIFIFREKPETERQQLLVYKPCFVRCFSKKQAYDTQVC